MQNDVTTRFKVDISDLKANIAEANNQIKLANAQFRAAASGMEDWQNSADGISAKLGECNTVLEAQKAKLSAYEQEITRLSQAQQQNAAAVEQLKAQYQQASQMYGENSQQAQELKKALIEAEKAQTANAKALNNAQVQYYNTQTAIHNTEAEIRRYEQSLQGLESTENTLIQNAEQTVTAFDRLKSTIAEQEKELESLKNAYASAVLEQGEHSQQARELATQIQSLSRTLEQNRTELSNAQNAADAFDTSLNALDSGTEGANSALDRLKNTISEQERELESLKNAYSSVALEQGEHSQQAQQLAREIDSLSNELQQNRTALSDAESAANAFDNTIEEMGEAAQKAESGFTVLKGAIASLVAEGIKSAVSAFKELITAATEANATFQAQTGATAEEMKAFSEQIQAVYKQGVGESLNDVAESMARIKQQMGDIDPGVLQEMTTNSIALRDTFGFEVSESIRAVDALMKQFGVSAEEAYNLIVQGAQNGLNQNENMLDVLNEYGVKFADMGFSAEEMFNALKNGVEAGIFDIDKLGDAMNEFSIRVKDGTADDAFQSLGLNVEEVTKKFGEGGEAARSAFDEVVTALNNVEAPLEKNRIGVELFGTMWEDTGGAAIQALVNTEGAIQQTNASMQELLSAKYSDIGSQFKEIGRIIQVDFLYPLVEQVTPMIQDLLTKIKEKLPEMAAKFQEVLPKIIEAFQNIISVIQELLPLFASVGAAVATYFAVTKIISFIDAIKNASLAFEALNLVMSLNPIGLVAAAIAGLVAGFLYLWNTSEEFRQFWINLWENVKEIVSGAIEGIKSAFSAVGDFFTQTLPEVAAKGAEGMKTAFQGVSSFFTETLPSVFQGVLSFFSENWQSLLLLLVNPFAGGFKLLYEHCEGFREFVNTFVETVKTMFCNGLNAVVSFFTETIPSFVNNIVLWFSQLPSKLQEIFTDILQKVIEWGSNFINTGKEKVTEFFTAVTEILSELPGKVLEFLTAVLNHAIEWGTNLINTGKEKVTEFFSTVITVLSPIVSKIAEILTNALNKVIEWGSNLLNKGKEIASNTLEGIVEGFQSLPDRLWEIGTQALEGFWNGLKSVGESIKDWAYDFFGSILEKAEDVLEIASPSKAFKRIGAYLMKGFDIGMGEESKNTIKHGKKIFENVVQNAKESINGVNTVLQSNIQPQPFSVPQNNGNTYYYYSQTINSPKALSRIELYRQSKNLLSARGGV